MYCHGREWAIIILLKQMVRWALHIIICTNTVIKYSIPEIRYKSIRNIRICRDPGGAIRPIIRPCIVSFFQIVFRFRFSPNYEVILPLC